jgi:hypothetical protein
MGEVLLSSCVYSNFFLLRFSCSYCVLDAAPKYEIHDECQLIVNFFLQTLPSITTCALANVAAHKLILFARLPISLVHRLRRFLSTM